MYICGVDEAGRGPVIGPMVVSCIVIDSSKSMVLEELGVRDSKSVNPRSRSKLYSHIISLAEEVAVRIVNPSEIDSAVERRTARGLNELEARMIAEILKGLHVHPGKVYVDSPDPIPTKFLERLRKVGVELDIVAENRADVAYPVVSAASIVAKVVRDSVIASLREGYGDFGSGYPSDPKTREFLLKWVEIHGKLPPIARRSWKTSRDLLSSP